MDAKFREQKHAKILYTTEKTGEKLEAALITRRSLVQIQPPQPYCLNKKDIRPKKLANKPFAGFFVPKIRPQFERYFSPISGFGEDLN